MQGPDETAAQEQVERRRLSRLIDALPVFSGFVSPEGHLIQTHPKMDATFLWDIAAFSYDPASITQIVALCECASKGERVQIERPYRKNSPHSADLFGRGLLTLSPVMDDVGHVEELAAILMDFDEAGLPPHDEFAPSRLSGANARIESMLSLAQTVIEASKNDTGGMMDRERLTTRLNTLASIIDTVSDLNRSAVDIETLIQSALETVPDTLKIDRLQRVTNGGELPISAVPLMGLLLAELIDNAREHGAWRDGPDDPKGSVSIQSEITDGRRGRVLRLHWIEDGGPRVPTALKPGFGFLLGERLLPQVTGGTATLHTSEEGMHWSFELPVPASDDGQEIGGLKS